MRVKRLTTWLVLGIAIALGYAVRRSRGGPRRRPVPANLRDPAEDLARVPPERTDEAGTLFVEAIAGSLLEAELGASADPELALLDDDQAQAVGESWLEHLEARSAELGPEPGQALPVSDDAEPHTGRRRATRDTPVADHGSGGPRGL